jgi:hypothetical protein
MGRWPNGSHIIICILDPSANSPLHICIRFCLFLCREYSLLLLAVELLPEVLGTT